MSDVDEIVVVVVGTAGPPGTGVTAAEKASYAQTTGDTFTGRVTVQTTGTVAVRVLDTATDSEIGLGTGTRAEANILSFRTSGLSSYDSRIVARDGTATAEQGSLEFQAATLLWNGDALARIVDLPSLSGLLSTTGGTLTGDLTIKITSGAPLLIQQGDGTTLVVFNSNAKQVQLRQGMAFQLYSDGGSVLKGSWGADTGDIMIGRNAIIKGSFNHTGATFGVFNANPAPQQTVTGSRGDGTALQSLLDVLAFYGLIADDSTG